MSSFMYSFGSDRGPSEPEPADCNHQKVYPVRVEGPYPWICASCLAFGEDDHLPVQSSDLFQKLKEQLDLTGRPAMGGRKIRNCYYCNAQVLGSPFDAEPARCGKCI